MGKIFLKIYKSVTPRSACREPPSTSSGQVVERKGDIGPRAETLLEVIIAVSVLVTIMMPATGMMVSSTRNTAYDRNQLIAEILTEEGLEFMVGIRNTNLLRFSPKAKDCWDTKPTHNDLATCDQLANKIVADPTNYVVWQDPNDFGVKMRIINGALSESLAAPLTDELYRLRLDGNTSLYNNNNPIIGSLTNFYRSIKIEKEDIGAMRVTSTVVYRSGSEVKKVKRKLTLTRQPI